VISIEIKAPAFSWTPSGEECLESGKRYVWYVGATSSLPPLRLRGGREEGLRRWSFGIGFEVDMVASVGMREVVKEAVREAVEGTVREYLTTEWLKSDSYKELTKVLTTEVTKGGGTIIGQGIPAQPLGLEGSSNTLYGSGAGNSLGDDDDGATFIGYRAGYNTNDGTEAYHGKNNTFVGNRGGYSNTTGYSNTFLGGYAGYSNTTGNSNIFLGGSAGRDNTTGNYNTFLGIDAGYLNTAGNNNVFLGYGAGFNETGSWRLYIEPTGGTPLIYGEFDNNLLRINGSGHFSGLGVSKSQLHFSLSNTDTGGWVTSVADNNFWLSSGAMWNQSAGGWVQKSPDGMAVMAGSGPSGYRVITRSGCAVGSVCAPVTRLTVDYSGNVGLGIAPAHPLHLAGGGILGWVELG